MRRYGGYTMDLLRKFIINRFLYLILLIILCAGIFPFMILYPLTMRLGIILGRAKLASKIDNAWNVIGKPYDALVKLVD